MLQIKNYRESDNWLPMIGSEATGLPLVKQGDFGADMLHFESSQKTSLHTHPGNHILFVVEGGGYLVFNEEKHDLVQGTCYLVPGESPHQVVAGGFGMILLSIADKHCNVDSEERLRIP